MEALPPTPVNPEWRAIIEKILNVWSSYQIGVEQQAGGDDTKDKHIWFGDVLADHITNTRGLNADSLEEWITSILYQDFDLVLEDDSTYPTAHLFIEAYGYWKNGERVRLSQLMDGLPSEERLKEARKASRRGVEDDGEEGEGIEEDDDEDNEKDDDTNDDWLLIKHFYDNFSILESTYRMNLLFPDKTGMCFCGFTAYIDINSIKGFFVDSPNAGNEEEAERLMTKLFRDGGQKEGKMIREALKRLNPSEEEFIALLGLTFWNIESTPAGDHLLRLSEKYKKNILHELHILYKDEQNQGEYAGRLGELFFLLMTFQTCVSKNPENFEIFRLLDVISDDSLVYQMMKQ